MEWLLAVTPNACLEIQAPRVYSAFLMVIV